MRVVSVNIGDLNEIVVRGRGLPSGIVKRPSPGPQRITASGVRGDRRGSARPFGEAHHAVSAYPHEHYGHWQRVLGRAVLPGGYFGENLTLEGALETQIRLGDVLRVGTSILQVSQPRLPCGKLAARVQRPGFARDFLESCRVGFHLRVLAEGDVRAGDPVVLLERDPASPTVDHFVRVSQIEYWDADGLEGLLSSPNLMPAWLDILEEKLARARGAQGWFGLRPLEVLRVEVAASNAVSVYLRCPSGRQLPAFMAGQSVTVALPHDHSRGPRRQYAISSSPHCREAYRITVAPRPSPSPGLPAGAVSTFLTGGLAVGDRVRCLAPSGAVYFDPAASAARTVFVSGGIGSAPAVAMLHAWASSESQSEVQVLHVDHDPASHPLRDEVIDLAARYPRLGVRMLYSRAHGENAARLHAGAMGDLVRSHLEALRLGPGTDLYVAGRSPFVNEIATLIAGLGIDPALLRPLPLGS